MTIQITVDREWLEKLLILSMANDHLSASSAGLKQRAINRGRLQEELKFVLGLSDAEADTLWNEREREE